MTEKRFNIQNYSAEEINNILWKLCYEPDDMLSMLKITDMSASELISFILDECHKNSKILLFGGDKPFSDTKGVDLGITNNIVRDAIIQRCYRAIYNEQHNIPKAINLINKEGEDASKKIFGGLKEIGFSNKEADYVKRTCNLYPISLLLERINYDYISHFENVEENYTMDSMVLEHDIIENLNEDSHHLANTNSENQNVTVFKILENKDNITQILNSFDSNCFDTIEGICKMIENYKDKIKILESVKTCAEELDKEGITLEYLRDNQDIIYNLIMASNRF